MPTLMQPDTSLVTINLAQRFGPVLVGRIPAMQLREEIEESVAQGELVLVDFTDVIAVSPSFGDEVFAKLDDALVNEGRVSFLNVSAQLHEIGEILRRTRAA